MKYFIRALEFIIIVVLIFLSVTTVNKINQVKLKNIVNDIDGQYHIAVVTDDLNSYASEKFISGIEESVIENNAVYEIYEIKQQSLDDVFKMIMITEVDGVILRLSNNALATAGIVALNEHKIKVIVVGNDAPESPRDVYIGTNKFNLGKHASTLASDSIGGIGNIAIILGSEYIDDQAIATSNFLNGVHDTLSGNSSIKLVAYKYTHSVRAEIVMDELLNTGEEIDALICTDPVDVNRIIRVLVDRNKVGTIKIIANGDTPEILDGMQKNLVYASVVENYHELGLLSVEYLNKLLNLKGVSSYVNIPFETIHQNVK